MEFSQFFISSLEFLKASILFSLLSFTSDGSLKLLCKYFLAPGKKGHFSFASSQTVITRSNFLSMNSVLNFETADEISMPSSKRTSIASCLTAVASVPALKASQFSPKKRLVSPSASCDLAELWVHINKTLFLLLNRLSLFGVSDGNQSGIGIL